MIFIFAYVLQGKAQSVVLKQEVDADSIPKKFGQNRKNYFHSYIGLGWVMGSSAGDSLGINYGKSFEFTFGWRYKLRLNNTFSLGGDLALNWRSFSILQDSSKNFPTTPVVIYEKERLACRNLVGSVYLRINYGKRGNAIGRFIDLIGFAEYNYDPQHITDFKNIKGNSFGAGKTRQINSDLVYLNAINYGATVRAGFNVFALYFSYRISDLFKPSYKFTELPRITAGIQLSVHK